MRHINRGYSLIEMMVVMSVASTLMIVAVGWIHQSLKLGSIIRERQDHHRSLLRLARQFRDDVHRGDSIRMVGDGEVVIQAGAESISYVIRQTGLAYRASRDGKLVRQNFFELADRSSIRWEMSELPKWITLVVDRQASDATTAGAPRPAELHVRAAVGRWQSNGVLEISP